jgi:hypothetical protein
MWLWLGQPAVFQLHLAIQPASQYGGGLECGLAVPVVVNGLNTVTNPISTSPKFYRLSQ